MRLFYFDEKMQEYERNLDFISEYKYLEQLYIEKPSSQIFLTLLAYSWYYLVEGDINQIPISYDWRFFESKFQEYVNLGLEKFHNDERIVCIMGYIIDLHWMYLGEQYENYGKKLLKYCIENANDRRINEMAHFWLDRNGTKLHVETVKELFETDSILDEYFRYVLSLD